MSSILFKLSDVYNEEKICVPLDESEEKIVGGIILNRIVGIAWGVSLGIMQSSFDFYTYNISLTDNLGNEMREMIRDSSNTEFYRYKTSTTSFIYGDVDYDEELTNTDVSTIMSYVAGSIEFSNAQMIFADYNGDGIVNLVDASAVLQYVQTN